jgi:hypothetical protein
MRLRVEIKEDGKLLQNVQKVNWDATMDTVNECMVIGIIVRDFEGHVTAAKNLTKPENIKPVAAETLVISAYGLAKAKVKQVIDEIWTEEILIYIFDIILLDQRTISL